MTPTSVNRMEIFGLINEERERQDAKLGVQNHPDGTGGHYSDDAVVARLRRDEATDRGAVSWAHVLLEEVFESLAERNVDRLRTELVQTAAICVSWLEALDRRTGT